MSIGSMSCLTTNSYNWIMMSLLISNYMLIDSCTDPITEIGNNRQANTFLYFWNLSGRGKGPDSPSRVCIGCHAPPAVAADP